MSKYNRTISDRAGNVSEVDVYDVLKAFNVTCPALQHLIKKALCAGLRGHKDTQTDLQDIADSAARAIELAKPAGGPGPNKHAKTYEAVQNES